MRKISETRQTIDECQATLNKRFDQLRTIVKTLESNGVTDKDFESYPRYSHKPAYPLAASLEGADSQKIAEALDICTILNSASEAKHFWRFKRKPTDETTQALLNRLMLLYYAIAG